MRLILAFEEAHGLYPGIRELAACMGVRSTNGVHDHLLALRKKGWLHQSRYVIPTEGALVELLGERCLHCHRGRVTKKVGALKLLP